MQQETAAYRPGRGGLAPSTSAVDGKAAGTTSGGLSVRRLIVMRIGYAVMGVGIAVRNWPLFVNRSEPWPLYEGGYEVHAGREWGFWHSWGFATR